MNRSATTLKQGLLPWALTAAAVVVLFPFSTVRLDHRARISYGVAISVHKSSPAYAALEDLRESFESAQPKVPENGHLIASGEVHTPSAIPVARIQRQIVLRGMTLKSPRMETIQVAANLPQPAVAQVSEPPDIEFRTSTRSLFRTPLRDANGVLLPLQQRKEIILNQVRDADLSAPAIGQIAKQMVEEELKTPIGSQRVIETRSGTPIFVGKPPEPKPERYVVADNKAAPAPPAIVPPVDLESAREDDAFNYSSLTPRYVPPDSIRPLWLSGQIQMTDGLAFMGPETRFTLKHVVNGQVVSDGRIWITEGRFEIHVKQAVGFLVAELTTRNGRIMGRGEMNLLDLGNIPNQSTHIQDIRIAMRPTSDGASFTLISGFSRGGPGRSTMTQAHLDIQAYAEAVKTNDEGVVNEPSLTQDSSFVVRARAKNHWDSLVVGQARESQDIRLFSNSVIEALINISLAENERTEAHNLGVVWGQVMENGKTVAGARVEMAGDLQPIYFNSAYLPDPSLRATSANGLFAFLKVVPGVQAIRVKAKNQTYPAQVFLTEQKRVSYVELHMRDNIVSKFKVFDILDDNRQVRADIRLVGTEKSLAVSRDDYVEFAVAADAYMIEADAGSQYEIVRTTITGAPHEVHLPLIRRDWLYQLRMQKMVAPLPGRGVVVGFMDDHDFEVEMTGYAPQEVMQVVYFDAHGLPLDRKSGVAGGGFAIFNAPPGMQTVYVHPVQSRETFSQIVVAEPQFVHVLGR